MFQKAFNSKDIWYTKHNIIFININLITENMPFVKESNKTYSDSVKVFLSHIPVLEHYRYYSENMVRTFQPHIIFSAHHHKSYVVQTSTDKIFSHLQPFNVNSGGNSVHIFEIKDGHIIEIVVPTCSYRMGVLDIGFGFGVIS